MGLTCTPAAWVGSRCTVNARGTTAFFTSCTPPPPALLHGLRPWRGEQAVWGPARGQHVEPLAHQPASAHPRGLTHGGCSGSKRGRNGYDIGKQIADYKQYIGADTRMSPGLAAALPQRPNAPALGRGPLPGVVGGPARPGAGLAGANGTGPPGAESFVVSPRCGAAEHSCG